jgi:hypothetical protein
VTVRFLQIAEIESDQAIRWYESRTPGLGDAFLIEVLSVVDRILLQKISAILKCAAQAARAMSCAQFMPASIILLTSHTPHSARTNRKFA